MMQVSEEDLRAVTLGSARLGRELARALGELSTAKACMDSAGLAKGLGGLLAVGLELDDLTDRLNRAGGHRWAVGY